MSTPFFRNFLNKIGSVVFTNPTFAARQKIINNLTKAGRYEEAKQVIQNAKANPKGAPVDRYGMALQFAENRIKVLEEEAKNKKPLKNPSDPSTHTP